MQKDKKPLDVIVVNSNYEKMARKKEAIVNNNSLAVQYNKDIKKAQKTNSLLAVIMSLIMTIAFSAVIWLYAEINIAGISVLTSKLILCGIGAVCIFAISNNLLSISKHNLEKNKKNILAIGESINFTTFIKGKKIKDYSLTSYAEIPYESQSTYLSLTAEDENGKLSEYSSMNKWGLILLPIIFDVIIDAENTTIYIPLENAQDNENVRNKIKDQINEEQVNIEREAKERAEKQLSLVAAEKEAIERVLFKNSSTIAKLQNELDDAKKNLNTIGSRYNEEKNNLLIMIESQEKEKSDLNSVIENLNKTIAEKEHVNTTLKEKMQKIESDLVSLTEKHNAALNSAESQISDKLNEISKKHMAELQSVNIAHQNEIASLKDKIVAIETNANNEKALKESALESLRLEKAAKQQVDTSLKDAQDSLSIARARIVELENKLSEANATLGQGSESTKRMYEDEIVHLKKQLQTATEQHAGELNSLKEKFTNAAKAAKDTLEIRHAEEIRVLKETNEKLISESNTEEIIKELNETKESLKKETAVRVAREKEIAFERDKVKTLEAKLHESDVLIKEKVNEVLVEKEKVENKLASLEKAYNKINAEKESILASSGVQERALIKEKDALLNKVKTLEGKLNSTEDLLSVKKENEELKKQVDVLRREDIEAVKKDCDERISLIKEEKDKMEKKMREALESAAKEKAERIKGENILRQHLSDEKKAEYEKKMAAQEAEIAKAKERAEKAQQDAMRAQVGEEKKEEKKRPPRHLIY